MKNCWFNKAHLGIVLSIFGMTYAAVEFEMDSPESSLSSLTHTGHFSESDGQSIGLDQNDLTTSDFQEMDIAGGLESPRGNSIRDFRTISTRRR